MFLLKIISKFLIYKKLKEKEIVEPEYIPLKKFSDLYMYSDRIYYFCYDTGTYIKIVKWHKCVTNRYCFDAIIAELDSEDHMFYFIDLYYLQ